MARRERLLGLLLVALSPGACRTSACCPPAPCEAPPPPALAPDRPAPPPPAVPSPVPAKAPAPVPPTDEGPAPSLTLALAESGVLSLEGRPLGRLTGTAPAEDDRTMTALRDRLAATTAQPGGRDADGNSRIALLLVASRRAKWKFAQWIMQVCADPHVRIFRIRFLLVPDAPATPSTFAPDGR